jgi:hypothetical protein
MAFVTTMSTRWIQFKVFNFQHHELGGKIYEQTGTKATESHSHHCLYCDTTCPQFDDLIKHSRENHPYHCYYCKTQFKEKLSEIGGSGQADRHFAAHYRLFLN